MQSIVMSLPDDLAASIEMTPEELASQVRLMAALKMFELGKISTGKAAELAGLSKLDFIEACARYHVSMFNYKPEEIEAELRSDLEAIREMTA
jgi:predicted HTH domain antitoxin